MGMFKPGQKVFYFWDTKNTAKVIRRTPSGRYVIERSDGRKITVAGYSIRPLTESDAQPNRE